MSETAKSDMRAFGHAMFLWFLWFFGVFVGSILGAAFHDMYVTETRHKVYLEAVERGYAREVETSAGKVFMWIEAPK